MNQRALTQLKLVNIKLLQLSFRLKVNMDPSIAFLFGIHNRGTFIPNLSRMFGSEFVLVYGPELTVRAEDLPPTSNRHDPQIYRFKTDASIGMTHPLRLHLIENVSCLSNVGLKIALLFIRHPELK